MRTLIAMVLVVFMLTGCRSSGNMTEDDSVVRAQEQNAAASIDESISDFLTEQADARMMDMEEGKLARERGTNEDVRRYGRWMVDDQTILLKEIRKLAKSKKVKLPVKLSAEKQDGLAELTEKNGDEFDKKFLKMITIDHRRDVRKFKNAVTLKDKDVSDFASKYLPTIESHLAEAQRIKPGVPLLTSER